MIMVPAHHKESGRRHHRNKSLEAQYVYRDFELFDDQEQDEPLFRAPNTSDDNFTYLLKDALYHRLQSKLTMQA